MILVSTLQNEVDGTYSGAIRTAARLGPMSTKYAKLLKQACFPASIIGPCACSGGPGAYRDLMTKLCLCAKQENVLWS